MSEDQTIAVSAVQAEDIPRPARRQSHNAKYHLIFQPAEAQPDKWFSFPASFVTGQNRTRKQVALHAAAAQRGIKVKTRFRGEVAYIRYVGPSQPKTEVRTETNFVLPIADAQIGQAEVEPVHNETPEPGVE